jgi:transcriptional regulator with XRE-family HTH domain
MLYWLGIVAREAREARDRKQVHIAAVLGVNQMTVSRFEQGRAWPRDPDQIIAAYAEDLDLDPRDLWEEACRRWRTNDPS